MFENIVWLADFFLSKKTTKTECGVGRIDILHKSIIDFFFKSFVSRAVRRICTPWKKNYKKRNPSKFDSSALLCKDLRSGCFVWPKDCWTLTLISYFYWNTVKFFLFFFYFLLFFFSLTSINIKWVGEK